MPRLVPRVALDRSVPAAERWVPADRIWKSLRRERYGPYEFLSAVKAKLTLGLAMVLAGSSLAGAALAQSIPPYVGSGELLPLMLQMPRTRWLQVNANLYSDVWTPPRPRAARQWRHRSPPSKIIQPWSGFAWDSNRGDLILYGGGHANYPGNDVYRWHSATCSGSARRCRARSTTIRSRDLHDRRRRQRADRRRTPTTTTSSCRSSIAS